MVRWSMDEAMHVGAVQFLFLVSVCVLVFNFKVGYRVQSCVSNTCCRCPSVFYQKIHTTVYTHSTYFLNSLVDLEIDVKRRTEEKIRPSVSNTMARL